MITLPKEIKVIHSLMQPGDQIFLVGGAVRDGLLFKPNQDLDFVCTKDPRIISRKLAEKLSGAFFMLDDERSACRVIAKNDQGGRLVFDFTLMRGQTLKDDLQARDFTFNAMAVDLLNPVEIIDPLNGEQDLIEKKLHLCNESSFKEDPLRVIRAIRYSANYGLLIEPVTFELLKQGVDNLSLVSKERKRDELFKILEIEKPWLALELIKEHNILPHLGLENLPEASRAFTRLRVYDSMVSVLSKDASNRDNNDLLTHSFSEIFSANKKSLVNRFCKVNQSERSVQALDGLIALLWDLDEIEGIKAAEWLALSREEQDQIGISLRHKCWILDQFSIEKKPDRKFIYHYFKALGVAGLDLAVLSLAEAAGEMPHNWQKEHWSDLFRFCHELIETWFITPEYVNPKLFLTGRDLMFEFDIPQGPRIGLLLDGLKEEQAIGSIQNRTQALAWVDGQIQKGFLNG